MTLVPQQSTWLCPALAPQPPGGATGFGPIPDPLASLGRGMISQLSPLWPRLSAGPPRHGHGHQVLCPPQGPGGEWGLLFPFTCSGGQRVPKRGSRQDKDVCSRERGSLAHLQAPCAGIPPLGQAPDRPHSRKEEHPHHLKPWDHLWLKVRDNPIGQLCCRQTSSCPAPHRGKAESIRKRTYYSKVTYLTYKTTTSLSPFPKGSRRSESTSLTAPP